MLWSGVEWWAVTHPCFNCDQRMISENKQHHVYCQYWTTGH